jgi:hypothetical protein
MSKKMMLLALAAVSAAMFALPAVASAGTWDIEPANGSSTINFTVSGGTAQLTTSGGNPVHCTSISGKGHYSSKTGGTINLTFHGCTTSTIFGTVSCGSSGTITTTTLAFDNVHLEAAKTTPGILITSNAGHFATFSCSIVNVTVTGNGVIGQITAPKCGETKNTATVSFTSKSAGVQTWSQVTTTGTVFGLKKGEESASQDATATITFTENAKLNCT